MGFSYRAYVAVAMAGLGVSLIVGAFVLTVNGSSFPEYLMFVVGLAMFPLALRVLWPSL